MRPIHETAVRQTAEQAWNADAALRAEFGDNFASYLAYAKADARFGIRDVNAAVQADTPLSAARMAKASREAHEAGVAPGSARVVQEKRGVGYGTV